MNRRPRALPWVAASWIAGCTLATAQPTTGRIAGVVRDGAGIVTAGAAVTLVEDATGVRRTITTDARGGYTFIGLPPGGYSVEVEGVQAGDGTRAHCTLAADGRVAIDLRLTPVDRGEAAAGRDGASVSPDDFARTIDDEQVASWPLNGRSSLDLLFAIPGSLQPTGDSIERMTNLAIDASINGSRPDANLLTLDGGFNMDSGSNNSPVISLGPEFIDHVRITPSYGPAEYGRQAGATIALVTRAGTNRFRGAAFEHLRRSALDANDYFANLHGVEKRSPTVDVFGFTAGGPLLRRRAFFFGGVEWKRVRRSANPETRSIPTSAMRRGDFGALPVRLTNPFTGQPFPGNVIPPGLITPDGRAIAAVYAAMAGRAASFDDGATADNAVFEEASASDDREEMIRVDLLAGPGHRLTTRLVLEHGSLLAPYGTSINSPLPTIATERVRPGYSAQVAHAWSGGTRWANEAVVNFAGLEQATRPVGNAWKRDTYGFTFPQIYDGGRYEASIPDVDVGGFAGIRGASGTLHSPTSDASVRDTLTVLAGSHTLKAGGVFVQNRKDQEGRADCAGVVTFSTRSGTSTGVAFADALLGNFLRYEESQLDPVARFRFRQVEAFLSDTWRAGSRLSLEAGVRAAWHLPAVALDNNTTSFDPARYDLANAVRMNTNGTIVAGTGDRFNGLARAGEVPPASVAHIPNAGSPFLAQIPIASSRGYYRAQVLVMPRASVSWVPKPGSGTVVRASVGLSYDRPDIGTSLSLVNNPPFVLSSTYQDGNLANPSAGAPAALTPWDAIGSLDPNLEVPRVWGWNTSVQRTLTRRAIFGEAAYVGGRGARLLRRPDINAASFGDLTTNALLGYNPDYWRPYKGFSEIQMYRSDARSAYDALQLVVGRTRGAVTVTARYTYSFSRDNASSDEEPMDPGVSALDDNWGPSGHDRRHVFVTTWTWRLPIVGKATGWTARVLGGWEISGIARYQSGRPFSVTGSTAIGTRRADYLGGNPYAYRVDAATGVVHWLDASRFAVAPPHRPGNSRRNQFVGPPYRCWDLSVRKSLALRGASRLEIQADVFNVLNHVNWNNPATSLTGSTPFGTILSAGPPREVQLGIRLTLQAP